VDIDAIEPFAVSTRCRTDDPQGKFYRAGSSTDQCLRAARPAAARVFPWTAVLSDVEGMSYQDVAKILGVPVGTVKSRLFRGRQLLQKQLYDYAVTKRRPYIKRKDG